ncbi:hypothetical protein LAZ67_14001574 [Cordylochernes scorpioides]|uniref:PiggyBac transposable element-derived protein domain-containing protein n=1 Tax=Cordylochernes scorpioides TaxID=51811 RepID=A0ABY6L695_9ARAC|nr:hypothetical protein LAZ67_14001574 [Cordylochernes scorpioides]
MILNPSWNIKTKNLVHLQLPVSMWGETRQRGERPVNGKVQRNLSSYWTFVTFWDKRACHISFQEIWADDGTGFEIFRSVMNCERFLFLLRCLRFNDLLTPPIREIFEEYVTNCKPMYHLGEYLTVDENIIPFKGRCSFKQYLPNKPAKYDINTYVLYCSRTSYVVNLEIYTGKQPEGPYQIIVLLNDYKLTLYVSERGKSVILLSTMHSTATIDEKTNEKKKPEIITFYNITKGGVDLLDQKTSLYSVGRLNSNLLFDEIQPQNIYERRKEFLKSLSLELVKEFHHIRSTIKSFSKPLRSIVRKHAGQSSETMNEDIPEPLSKAQKRCHLCPYKKDRKTKPLCQKCQTNFCKEHSIIMRRQCIRQQQPDDENSEAGASSEPHLLTQGDLNDLVRDLDLSKNRVNH